MGGKGATGGLIGNGDSVPSSQPFCPGAHLPAPPAGALKAAHPHLRLIANCAELQGVGPTEIWEYHVGGGVGVGWGMVAVGRCRSVSHEHGSTGSAGRSHSGVAGADQGCGAGLQTCRCSHQTALECGAEKCAAAAARLAHLGAR